MLPSKMNVGGTSGLEEFQNLTYDLLSSSSQFLTELIQKFQAQSRTTGGIFSSAISGNDAFILIYHSAHSDYPRYESIKFATLCKEVHLQKHTIRVFKCLMEYLRENLLGQRVGEGGKEIEFTPEPLIKQFLHINSTCEILISSLNPGKSLPYSLDNITEYHHFVLPAYKYIEMFPNFLFNLRAAYAQLINYIYIKIQAVFFLFNHNISAVSMEEYLGATYKEIGSTMLDLLLVFDVRVAINGIRLFPRGRIKRALCTDFMIRNFAHRLGLMLPYLRFLSIECSDKMLDFVLFWYFYERKELEKNQIEAIYQSVQNYVSMLVEYCDVSKYSAHSIFIFQFLHLFHTKQDLSRELMHFLQYKVLILLRQRFQTAESLLLHPKRSAGGYEAKIEMIVNKYFNLKKYELALFHYPWNNPIEGDVNRILTDLRNMLKRFENTMKENGRENDIIK